MTGVEDALGRLTEVADWMRWRVGAPADGELACATLAGSPGDVARAVATSADVRGTDDPVVLASLWWQGYAYRVGGTALACWLLTGVAPDVRAERMAVGVGRGRPASVVYGSTEATDDAGQLSDWLFAGHLDLVAASLGAGRRLGSGLVWGNVAAACAAGAGAVREAAGPGWHDGVAAFLAAAPHDLDGLGAWEPTPAWAYHRRTCCLWWKTTTSNGALCSDCSLHRDTEGE
ncbi:MAG TPA: IucA/IucC family C-terminal-domain containing protein [Acidimicrobiales bacterium]|nr:IucA/IucC family C-terminal-domain containing protein [Acidimicrobiales bacterium]